jgi:hypothetical protein
MRTNAAEEQKKTGKAHGEWWAFRWGQFVLCDGRGKEETFPGK